MNTSKLENLLELSLNATTSEREKSQALQTGYLPEKMKWEIIVKYSKDMEFVKEEYGVQRVTELLNEYAILEVTENQLDQLSADSRIEFIEKPKRLYFALNQAKGASCIVPLQTGVRDVETANLSGKGVLAAVIDSGIDYEHPDFRNEDGRSRILYLWDQTISTVTGTLGGYGVIPEPYGFGIEYDKGVLDEALSKETEKERMQICPSIDRSGHGTHVAGIFAGNGRASAGEYRGIAYESELIVVKLGIPREDSFPRTTELMQAIDYCVRKSIELGKPMVMNLSFGNAYGSHDGYSLLETYLDDVSNLGKNGIVIGTGNEGNGKGHTSGDFFVDSNTGEQMNNMARIYQSRTIEYAVGQYETSFGIQIWKSYSDDIDIAISHPSGKTVGPIQNVLGTQRFRLERTEILLYYGEPAPYSPYQEIYLDFIPTGNYIDSGIWEITLFPRRLLDGKYDLWLPVEESLNIDTGFLYPVPDTTLTIPSTARKVISVGAYDSYFNNPSEFSGRGFTREGHFVKPELVAPGVNIVSCAPGGGYTSKTGTSMATPFVSGGAALLMEWGIVKGNDPYLYGEKIKAYLIKGARQFAGLGKYPNPRLGWGALCVKDALPD